MGVQSSSTQVIQNPHALASLAEAGRCRLHQVFDRAECPVYFGHTAWPQDRDAAQPIHNAGTSCTGSLVDPVTTY